MQMCIYFFFKLQRYVVCAVTNSLNRLEVILKHGLSNNKSWGLQEKVAMFAWYEMVGKMQNPEKHYCPPRGF